MSTTDTQLSRLVSHALRHEPWLYELELDEEGWVPIDQLLAALQESRDWRPVDRAALERMISVASKQRHQIDGDRIRALYGHSVPGRIRNQRASPPARLFHGTAPETWPSIQADGLLPMSRQYVHLSVDRETATLVGQRKSSNPVILVVDAAAASLAGTPFYQGNESVWLADVVPARYVRAQRSGRWAGALRCVRAD